MLIIACFLANDNLARNAPLCYTVAMWYVYILRCADGSLYTGTAVDAKARERVHNSGRGAKYTRSRLPVRLVYAESLDSRGAALSRELAVKRLTHAEKERLIAGKDARFGQNVL